MVKPIRSLTAYCSNNHTLWPGSYQRALAAPANLVSLIQTEFREVIVEVISQICSSDDKSRLALDGKFIGDILAQFSDEKIEQFAKELSGHVLTKGAEQENLTRVKKLRPLVYEIMEIARGQDDLPNQNPLIGSMCLEIEEASFLAIATFQSTAAI